MKTVIRNGVVGLVALSFIAGNVSAQPGTPPTEPNKERLVLDDMEDVSDWYNGSPVETKISASDAHAKQGRFALKFGNVVDHTQGETNYPIGWPRAGKDMGKTGTTDWSGYDFFECWIYVETNRESLPGTPLSVGFYHSGHRRSSSFPLTQVKKNAWERIVLPVSKLMEPADVKRVQFNISESNYSHGDRVDFFIDDMVLTRFVHPIVAELTLDRNVLFANDKHVIATYRLMGYRGDGDTAIELTIGQGGDALAGKARAKADPQGEVQLTLSDRLHPGTYWAELTVRDRHDKAVDRKRAKFRVIDGPF